MRRIGDRRLLAAWVASRLVLVVLVVAVHALGAQDGVLGDARLYERWARTLLHGGGLPVGDGKWQYPPGAAVVLALPALSGLPYVAGMLVLLLAVDAAVLAALARHRPAGVRMWILGPLALGPVALARFDLVSVAFAVVGLLAAGGAGSARAGAAFALGSLVKVWPAVLALAAPGRRVFAGVAAVGAATAGVLLVGGGWRGAGSFLGAQDARGLQLESVAATPLVLLRLFGVGPAPAYDYGSWQFGTPAAHALASACSAAQALVLLGAALLWVRRGAAPGDPADRGLALLLLLLLTSRVLSPQYLLWLFGVAACCPAGGPARDARRRVGALLLVAALLSHVVYPWRYHDLEQGRVVASLVFLARNTVLVTAAVLAGRVLTAARHTARPSRPPPRGSPAPPARTAARSG